MRTLEGVICPKCQDLMRTISRGSVHVEQCENCKGVFLDGGELEQIIAAERAHYAQPYRPEGVPVSVPAPPPAAEPTAVVPVHDAVPVEGEEPPAAPPPAADPPPPAAGPPPPYQPPPGTQTGPPPPYQPPPGAAPAAQPPAAYPGGYYAPQPHYPRRKRSFLEELLD